MASITITGGGNMRGRLACGRCPVMTARAGAAHRRMVHPCHRAPHCRVMAAGAGAG